MRRTQGDFFHHTTHALSAQEPTTSTRVFPAASAAAMSSRGFMTDSGPSHYSIGPIVAHALAFREQLRQHAPVLADSNGGFAPPTRPPRFFSAQVIERQVFADGSADLVAFADGRVR